ncbi:hypothetical protein BY458DRAFT_13526 [Sporodiniella umbellata]|nr:hypothetical protein BY458DRAFT_13526 [Sporodiniella umbellata]
MSLYTVVSLALALKKMTRKASKKHFKRKSLLIKTEEAVRKESRLSLSVSLEEDGMVEAMQALEVAKNLAQTGSEQAIIVRDFAYPKDSGPYSGQYQDSSVSLSSPDFNGREARALFDFVPETEYEIGLKAGQAIWVQYRQCPGWLIADVKDQTGLVPESYIEWM